MGGSVFGINNTGLIGEFASDDAATIFANSQGWLKRGVWYFNTVDFTRRYYDGTNWAAESGYTLLNEYTGFPNQTDSAMSFVDGTRTFTIQPAVAAFDFYQDSVQYHRIAADNVVITDIEGLWYIYYLAGVLTASQIFWNLRTMVPVAIIYWDATNNLCLLLADERHGLTMDWATHAYLHETIGTRFADGIGITATTTGTGNLDADAQVALDNGVIYDEDLRINIVDDAPQDLTPIAEIPVFYRDGAAGDWRIYGPTDFPCVPADLADPPDAVSRLGFNELVGGPLWQITEITNNQYAAVWLYATNNVAYPIIAILGQRDDVTISLARENNTLESLQLGDLPLEEMKVIYRIIFQTAGAYGNIVNARIRDVQDYRNISNLPSDSFVPTQHGSLSGLQNDDHSNVYPRVVGRDGALVTVAALNAAYPPGVAYREWLAVVQLGAGQKDKLLQCIKESDDAYYWVEILLGSSIGGILNYAATGLDGVLVTIVPNGAGDVTAILQFDGVVSESAGGVSNPAGNLTPGNTVNIYDDGVDVLTLAVTALGAVTIQRPAGAATFDVNLGLRWI